MKSSNDEPLILLSKNNARTLLARNAVDAATSEKQCRLLQTEQKAEERSFRKKRERILQRHSRIVQSERPLFSSVSLSDNRSNPSPSSETSSSLRRCRSMISLPDIHVAQRKTTKNAKKYSDTTIRWQAKTTGEGLCTETCDIDDWKELRKCRYLRNCSTKKESLDGLTLFPDHLSRSKWR